MSLQDRYSAVKMTAAGIKAQAENLRMTISDISSRYQEQAEKYEALKKAGVIIGSSMDIMRECIDKASKEQVDRIANLLTYSLKTIFTDRDYTVEVLVGDKRGTKTCELWLKEVKGDTVVRSPFDDGIGGGVLAVAGFILQVYYIGLLKQSPIMFMDESFSQVSTQYIPALMGFIEELATKKGFVFILISHDDRLIPYAKKTYLVEMGKIKEVSR